MGKPNLVLSLAAAASGAAVLVSACAPPAALANGNLTVRCAETLVPNASAVTNGGVVGTGHCTMTGQLHDSGRTTDYRRRTP